MQGSLSPSVLAKNKRNAVFRLVSERTDFSSEKSSCYRPTSEGICFAKQSEQWLTKPLLSQGEASESVPRFRPILLRKLFYFFKTPLFLLIILRKGDGIFLKDMHENILHQGFHLAKASSVGWANILRSCKEICLFL